MVEIPVIPENAPFSLEQRLWLNGFIAGYFSRGAIPSSASANRLNGESCSSAEPSLLILFGTQTGTSQILAKRICKEASSRGFKARAVDSTDYLTIDWQKETTLFVVTSTYGEGDMPDNAQAFWVWLQTDAAKVLAHLRFSVLGLGDKTYSDFCGAAKKLDARLEQLGARRICPRVDCDVDYEGPAKEWTAAALAAALESPAKPGSRIVETSLSAASGKASSTNATTQTIYSKTNPYPARLLANICLNKSGSNKEIRHFEFDLDGSKLSYEPGDALGVVPLNCNSLVCDILQALQCTGDELVTAGTSELPLREALSSQFDIAKPSREFLTAVSEQAKDSELAQLLTAERAPDLKAWLWGRGIIDLLLLLPAPFPPGDFVKLLRKLSPRLYSISSSPKAHPGQVHLTVSALRYESHGRKRKGVASTFLADSDPDCAHVRIYVQPSHGFKLPSNGDTPVIMAGPGTGIAPFRGFLEERRAVGAKGKNWLFFGDQKESTDFLYEEELRGWQTDSHLARLDLAFSRDQTKKVYVQHRMLENADTLWAWLQDGAHFYVCGDASCMAKDVDAALHRVAETAGGLTPESAVEYVQKLKKEKRYQRDVY